MKKSLATLSAIALTMTMMGAPMAFADDSVSSSTTGQITTTLSTPTTTATIDSNTQSQADTTASQLLGDTSKSAAVSGTNPADGKKHVGKGNVVDQLQDIINRAYQAGKHQTKYAQQLKAEIAHLRQTQKAIQNDQKNLLDAAHKFVDAIHKAETAGDKQAVVKGIETGKQIISTLKSALSDESKVNADVQAARQAARSGHVDKALALIHEAETKEKAKDDAMKQAAEALRLLAADISAQIQSDTTAQAGVGENAGNEESGTTSTTSGDTTVTTQSQTAPNN